MTSISPYVTANAVAVLCLGGGNTLPRRWQYSANVEAEICNLMRYKGSLCTQKVNIEAFISEVFFQRLVDRRMQEVTYILTLFHCLTDKSGTDFEGGRRR